MLFDDNGISIDGSVDITVVVTLPRVSAYGWDVLACDGHDMDAVSAAISKTKTTLNKPTLIRCKTEIGKGSPNRTGTAKAHGAPLGAEENALTRRSIGWTSAPFDIPAEFTDYWRTAGDEAPLWAQHGSPGWAHIRIKTPLMRR